MALTTPTSVDDVIDRALNDVYQALVPYGGKPLPRNSWLRAVVVAVCNRVFDQYYAIDLAALEALPDTAIENLERWAAIYGILRTAGLPSSGLAIATGTVGKVVPDGSVFADGSGREYAAVGNASVVARNLSVASITRSGSVALLTTTAEHNLATNVPITVAGATETEYNVVGAEILTVESAYAITYAVSGAPSSPATGTITVAFDTAIVAVEASVLSDSEDQDADAALTLESPIFGVDDLARASYAGITGGVDRETDDALRTRLLERIQNPVAHFNVADIERQAKTVAGVTRVFVREITPSVGRVTVHFMRDNDANPIPDGAKVAEVKAVLDLIRPANTDYDDLIVSAPTAVPVNFAFTSITPDSATMRAAIRANLAQLFAEGTSVGETLTQDAYRSAIYGTIDATNGRELEAFSLSTPTGDRAVAENEIPTLGTISGI